MSKKVKIELDYDIEDCVYLKTDPDFLPRMVISINILPGGLAVYCLACGMEESEHYAIEITDSKPV